jgi:phosphatidylglycerol:prolipoprotein diacylglycerol transferase
MASHGGFIGVIVALLLFARGNLNYFFKLADVLTVPIAIGLFFGRLGNLINGELYGTVTTLPWAMSFPGVEGLRHPTQIYAMLKDLTIALVCFLHLRATWPAYRPGSTIGVFLCLYAVLRFIVEIFRDQPLGYTHVIGLELSRGQLLTFPLLALGLVVLWFTRKRAQVSA